MSKQQSDTTPPKTVQKNFRGENSRTCSVRPSFCRSHRRNSPRHFSSTFSFRCTPFLNTTALNHFFLNRIKEYKAGFITILVSALIGPSQKPTTGINNTNSLMIPSQNPTTGINRTNSLLMPFTEPIPWSFHLKISNRNQKNQFPDGSVSKPTTGIKRTNPWRCRLKTKNRNQQNQLPWSFHLKISNRNQKTIPW